MRPGSMLADSREIYQEGLVIPPVRQVAAGVDNDEITSILLANVRTPAVRLGDLRAQIAANHRAGTRLAELAGQRGHDTLRAAFTNVETSQRLTDTVPLALGQTTEVSAQGQGQGTMNNLIIGGADWSYYETRGGGQGASRAAPGASGRHVGIV
ncbi:MAG: hydantoinase B/oxoprolinase family protein [Salinisphaera sp.]